MSSLIAPEAGMARLWKRQRRGSSGEGDAGARSLLEDGADAGSSQRVALAAADTSSSSPSPPLPSKKRKLECASEPLDAEVPPRLSSSLLIRNKGKGRSKGKTRATAVLAPTPAEEKEAQAQAEEEEEAQAQARTVTGRRREVLSEYTCPICFFPPSNATLTPCGHVCCGSCLFTAVRTTLQRGAAMGTAVNTGENVPRCPVCRAVIRHWDGRGGGVIGLKVKMGQ